jgi:hypothetical protein
VVVVMVRHRRARRKWGEAPGSDADDPSRQR